MTTQNFPKSESRKVLILRLSSLGDVVLATSALEPFAQNGWEIHFATKKSFASLLVDHPRIRSVYSFDSRAGGERAAREHFFSWVEKERFDLILDLHDSLRTRFWRHRLKDFAPVRVARKERIREILILVFRLGRWLGFGPGGRARKMRRLAEECVTEFGGLVKESAELTSLGVSPSVEERVRPLLPQGDYIVILPGSAWPGKKWPFFADLAERVARLAPVVVLGGPEDWEGAEIAARAQVVNSESRSLCGETTVAESMLVVKEARLVVGNDTGMVHVAEALGRNAIVLEGPTHPDMGFSVFRRGSEVVGMDLLCRPCSKGGKICWRFGTRKCLTELSADRVWSVVESHWKKQC